MMRFLNLFLILIFLAIFTAKSQDSSPIPEKIRNLLVQRPGMQNRIVAVTSKNRVSYFLIVEPDRTDNTQVLITVDPQGEAKVINRLHIIFPLKRYIPNDDDVVKDLANQYVKFLVNEDLDGVKGLQKNIDHNPRAFSPNAPELIEAYQKAGLKLPLAPSPDEADEEEAKPDKQE